MARKKIQFDEEEINEILDLYIEIKLNGVVSKLSNNGVCNFNKEIADNDNFIRKNGKKFNLYKYNFWAGKYNGEDGYGKKKITERKEKSEVKVVGERFAPDVVDVIKLVNDFHKKPAELSRRLCKLFNRQIQEKEMLNKRLEAVTKQNTEMRERIEMMDTALTNIMFQSQSPGNSLNNMFSLSKTEDEFCYKEFKNMFNNNEERINKMIKSTYSSVDQEGSKDSNVVPINSKKSKEKYSRL